MYFIFFLSSNNKCKVLYKLNENHIINKQRVGSGGVVAQMSVKYYKKLLATLHRL